MIEERHEMVDARPLGLLVADEANGVVLTLLTQLKDAAEGLPHLDVHPTILSTQMDKKFIHDIAAQRMVNLP